METPFTRSNSPGSDLVDRFRNTPSPENGNASSYLMEKPECFLCGAPSDSNEDCLRHVRSCVYPTESKYPTEEKYVTPIDTVSNSLTQETDTSLE